MNARAYHAQGVLIARRTGTNEFGEPVFAPVEAIACRFERAGKIVRRHDGTSALSNAALYTVAPIAEGDCVRYEGRAHPVLAVVRATSLAGEFVQNEAYLGTTRLVTRS